MPLVLGLYRQPAARFELQIALLKTFKQSFCHLVQIKILTKCQRHRSWVGQGSIKLHLVHIQADTDDGGLQLLARKGVLDKNSGDFVRVEINIVGPFYLEGREEEVEGGGYFVFQQVAERHRHRHAEVKLSRHTQPCWAQNNTERQVLARRTHPSAAKLTAPG